MTAHVYKERGVRSKGAGFARWGCSCGAKGHKVFWPAPRARAAWGKHVRERAMEGR